MILFCFFLRIILKQKVAFPYICVGHVGEIFKEHFPVANCGLHSPLKQSAGPSLTLRYVYSRFLTRL